MKRKNYLCETIVSHRLNLCTACAERKLRLCITLVKHRLNLCTACAERKLRLYNTLLLLGIAMIGIFVYACNSNSINKNEDVDNDSIALICNTDSTKIHAIASSDDSTHLFLTELTERIKEMLFTEDNDKNIAFVEPPYHISKKGIKFIKKFESCSLKKYRYKRKNGTYEKYYTIGWGHVLYPNDKYYNRSSISQTEADKLFIEDTKWLNQSCNNLISELSPHFRPTQGFVDGLCSLIYNCGENGIRNSKFFIALKKCRYDKDKKTGIYYINKKDYAYCMTLVKHTKIFEPGHKPRRKAESKLMTSIN